MITYWRVRCEIHKENNLWWCKNILSYLRSLIVERILFKGPPRRPKLSEARGIWTCGHRVTGSSRVGHVIVFGPQSQPSNPLCVKRHQFMQMTQGTGVLSFQGGNLSVPSRSDLRSWQVTAVSRGTRLSSFSLDKCIKWKIQFFLSWILVLKCELLFILGSDGGRWFGKAKLHDRSSGVSGTRCVTKLPRFSFSLYKLHFWNDAVWNISFDCYIIC